MRGSGSPNAGRKPWLGSLIHRTAAALDAPTSCHAMPTPSPMPHHTHTHAQTHTNTGTQLPTTHLFHSALPPASPLQMELDKAKFFAKPKLALDAVGGASAMRLADALAEGGQLVVYGSVSGKSAQFTWRQWVFQGIQVGILGAGGVCVCMGGGGAPASGSIRKKASGGSRRKPAISRWKKLRHACAGSNMRPAIDCCLLSFHRLTHSMGSQTQAAAGMQCQAGISTTPAPFARSFCRSRASMCGGG